MKTTATSNSTGGSRHRRAALAFAVTLLASVSVSASAQEYGDYGGGGGGGDYGNDYQDYAGDYAPEDNLYHDYAMKQQDKAAGGGGGGAGSGAGGFAKLALATAGGWILGGKIMTKRAIKPLKDKHRIEHKALYTQYYDDVYKLQKSNEALADAAQKLQRAVTQSAEEREMEAIQRDYDEFKQPDIDGDDRISRAEFNMYVKNYLSNYPGLEEKDYPRYEDFDLDGDGYISFQEYAQQMAIQVQKAERLGSAAR